MLHCLFARRERSSVIFSGKKKERERVGKEKNEAE